MDQSKNHHQQHLGVNKLGKNIRKSPLHQPSYATNPRPPHQQPPPPAPPHQPQPQVYNISKNDFRSIVQQLTGTPSRDPQTINSAPPPRPPQPRPPSTRLHKIRPPPLTPIARPPPPPVAAHPNPQYQNPNPNNIRPPNFNHPSFFPRPVTPPGAATPPGWTEAQVSAYMRYLESSLLDSSRATAPGLLPSPAFPPTPPGMQSPYPSPSAFLNLLSPKSPYPLLSPGFQYPPLLTPNFSFSPFPQPGILGPGPGPRPGQGPPPPPSPGLLFPPSPSGFLSPSAFLPLLSPRWRDM